MTGTSKTGSKPPPEKPSKTDKKKDDKDKSQEDQDKENLEQAIGMFTVMMLQKILQGAKRRRAEINEDDPDKFM